MRWSEQRDRNADALHDNRLWQRLRLLVTGKVSIGHARFLVP